jgi:7-cyano-7-deazaguanine synthase
VPDETTPDEAVFLPGRNPLLLIKPMLWCAQNGVRELALATLASNPFDDATPGFFAQFESLMHEAVGERVRIVRPLEQLTKFAVMELGAGLPLEWTFSCLAPKGGRHCGRCNKCAERQAAFAYWAAGDPTEYASAIAPVRPL